MDDADPFAQYLTPDQPPAAPAAPATPDPSDPFAKFLEPPEEDTSFGGALLHSFERGVAPAVGSLPAIGAGAEAGASIGAFGGPIGAAAGGVLGGLAGGIVGQQAISAAQDWALKQLPASWQDFLGQSETQQKAEAEQQPLGTFIGGLVPFALTMKPSLDMASKALPTNATALQRIMANPLTARLFGGGIMGGMELGTEVAHGEQPNWTNVAIATGFGIVFNKPTQLGERLIDIGAGPARALLGRPEPEAVAQPEAAKPAPAAPDVSRETSPTVAQAGDAKVIGPGIDEDVFMGSHTQATPAEMTAQDAARTETVTLRPETAVPSPAVVARQMEPELFARYDALVSTRNDLAEHLAAVRDPTAEVQPAQSAAIQLQINAAETELRALAPEVASAHRRAADAVQSPVVEPETAPEVAPVAGNAPAVAAEGQPVAPVQVTPEEAQAQSAAIAQEVTANLIAAGRPADEAGLAGQLLGERYRARAAGLGNAVSPKALYDTEGPIIRAARERVTPETGALAQSKRERASGYIDVVDGVRRLLTLTKNADASSFLHESGHQWLEELLRDSVHPSAIDRVKDDAQTVRDWLGISDIGEPIKTRQHEKFARSFEQYMREGVAPSPKLARVFAQFRQWLTQIYQTIRGLGAPINEDIRQVFDRLLAEEPNRTVIAPEREAEPSIASIHETEAIEAAPHEAHGIGDRIVAERDDYIAQQPPEVQNEIAAALAQQEAEDAIHPGASAGNETGPGTGGPTEVAAAGGQPEPVAPSLGSGIERGPQLSGGGAGLRQGSEPAVEPANTARLRDNGPGAAGALGASHPIAPKPADVFGPEQSPFVDKAGNIRIENLTSDQDVAQAIRDSAQENNDFIGDRRGIITDGQVLDLADALGMDVTQLNRRKLGEAFNAEQVVAARKLLIQSATDVAGLMKKAAVGGDAELIAYAQAKAKHQMIQAQVAGITAEAGRALRAFRSLAGQAEVAGVDQFLRQATGKTLFQLKEEAKMGALLDTPEKVSKFTRDAQKRNFGSMILEYWINGLISGPATHTTYMVGNVLLSLQKAGPETAAAALIGRLRRNMGRPGETVRLGEIGAQMRGMATSLPSATKSAIDALRTGVTTRLPGEDAKALPFQPGSEFAPSAILDESVKYSDALPALYGTVQGIRDGIVSMGALLKAGGVEGAPVAGFRYSPLGAIPDIAVRGVPVLPIGTAVRLPGRVIAGIHSFFRTVNYSMAKNALAYRSASEAGLSGTAFDAHVAGMRQNPTPAMMEQARGTATQLTLMGKGSEFVQALSRLTNTKILGLPILKFIDPFVHIAGNILDQSIVQRTPVGLLSPELRADLMGKNGNIAQDTAMARMLVGTALSVGFGSLAAQGLISGSGPSDPQDAAMWRLAGNQAHSVRVGNMWYQVNRLGPMGMLAGVSADMYEVAHAASEGDLLRAASELQHAFTQNVLDESFMRGPSELIQALDDPGRYGQAYIRNFLSSFVPYSVGLGQIARAGDPYSRSARSIMDAIKVKIPGLSETLQPRIDVWGSPIPSGDVLGPRGLSAIYASQISKDPVNLAMLNLGISPAMVERKVRGVDLTDEQYTAYAILAGRTAKARLDQMVRSSAWQTWPPQTQHDVVLETIRQSREAARGMVMARWPAIAAQAVQNKLAPLVTGGN